MIASASPHQRMMIATIVAGAALLAALWLLAISPKRSESAAVSKNVGTQQQRLSAAQTQLASYQSAKKQYPGLLAELRGLDEAVPARGEISVLLRQLQKRAKASRSTLRLVSLEGGTATAAPAPAAGGSAPPATLTPGAVLGAGGLAKLPFSFEYSGRYFDLVHILAAARRTVSVKSGDLKINGRLVTIEGLTFQRETADSSLITASVSGTAYIAAAPPTPTTPATPADATQGGS
jgi:Tfp pilus assembly protein PilO